MCFLYLTYSVRENDLDHVIEDGYVNTIVSVYLLGVLFCYYLFGKKLFLLLYCELYTATDHVFYIVLHGISY